MTKKITFYIFLLLLIFSLAEAPAGGNRESEDSQNGSLISDQNRPEAQNGESGGKLLSNLNKSALPYNVEQQFDTDFSRTTVPYSEITSGGPGKDGIPAIDSPSFEEISEADKWLEDIEPVLVTEAEGEAHVYPLQILMWHEIVNDRIADVPISVTYCPLCNTGVGFSRTFEGQVLDFGTTGNLRYSNLVMYDRQTETWWQQASGNGIVGKYAGRQLDFHPVLLLSWADAKKSYPQAKILSRETGYSKPYGSNPYSGYDNPSNSPFLYQGPEPPSDLSPMNRVITVHINDEKRTFPYPKLKEERVITDTLGGTAIAAFWQAGTATALGAGNIAGGRDVGTANAFYARIDGMKLDFAYNGSAIIDRQTGSEWNVSGRAVTGELKGKSLEPVVTVQHFWFSSYVFHPEAAPPEFGIPE